MIYITGDTHGELDIKRLSNKRFKDSKNLSKNDYVIVLGDFGLLWDGSNEEKYWTKWLNDRNFTTLFIDGNHENFDRLNEIPVEDWNGGKVHKISDNIIHLMRGQVFTIEGKKFFTFGGATSIDKMYRRENISWWKEELPSTRELEEGLSNLDVHNNKIDYILTHTCSTSSLMDISRLFGFYVDELDVLNKYFETIKSTVEFKKWYCGHFHKDVNMSDKEIFMYESIRPLQ